MRSNIAGRLKWFPVSHEYEVKMAARCTELSVAKDICVNSSLSIRLFFLAGWEKEATDKEKPDTTVFIVVFHLLIA